MNNLETKMTRDELKIYLLLYGADVDLVESNEEIDLIKSGTTIETYNKVYQDYSKDNDYQRIQKIQKTISALNYSENDINDLMAELKELFQSDGKYDIVEQNVFRLLKRILK